MVHLRKLSALFGVVLSLVSFGLFAHGKLNIDLSHPIPTYAPGGENPLRPNLSKPFLDSRPVPTFGAQSVLTFGEFPTNQGHFSLGTIALAEQHGTHLLSASHYVNNAESLEEGFPPAEERKRMHQLTAADLIGHAVLVDISARVEKELARNGGMPSPDRSVTDFSETSPNVVTADDISAVEKRIRDGVWIVINTGWSKFYFSGNDFAKDPYINGFNHPGMSKASIDRLIEIMQRKGVLIGGIIADNIGIVSGQSAAGDDDKWTNSWYGHVRLLQRGVKFVANANNLGQLAQAENPGRCTIVVGALKHIAGTGGPARVFALCP